MLTGRTARRAAGGLLVLTVAGAGPVLATKQPALADSVRSTEQWVLDAVDAPTAWPVTQGSGVLVAVIDSGVRPDVSDLTGSVTSGPDYSGVGTPASDANWGMHGTWMASLIAGHGHGPAGADGISGVAPQAKILSIRVLPDKKDPGYSQYKHESSSRGERALAEAIRYAVAHRASVISMSLGYGAPSRVVRAALQDATRHGVVVVASSGNSRASAKGDGKAQAPYSFPADYPGVLGVAAVDRSGSPASFSSDNLSVQIAAPGVKVPAQGSDGQYWLVSGTSPACALTAGVAALIKSVYPQLAPALVIRAITVSAQNQPKPGYDDRVGFGTLDAAVALATARKLTAVGVTGRGIGVHSHFGGGPQAIPAAPVGPRGSGQLMLFGGLAVACLIVSLIAAGRLLLYRRRVTAAQAAPPPGPSYPGAPPPALGYPTAQPGSGRPGSYRPAPSYQATQPPAGPATSWSSQDNGTRPPGLAHLPGQDQPDQTVASPQPPRAEPHPSASPLPPAQPLADLASTWWSQDNGTRTPDPAAEPHPGPPPPLPAQPLADLASTWWSQGNGSRPPGPAPSSGGDQPDQAVASLQPPPVEPPQPEPARTEPHPSPPSAWPGPPAQVPWPGNDDSEDTSPSGIPPVPAEPPAGSPPLAPGPVRPGRAPAGPSRYLQDPGRPSPSGSHATRRDQPQPAPAWARNRRPGSQASDSAEPDPQDEP
jgi:Subtilase family